MGNDSCHHLGEMFVGYYNFIIEVGEELPLQANDCVVVNLEDFGVIGDKSLYGFIEKEFMGDHGGYA